MEIKKINTECLIVGGGPAGMMLGFLLARAGIKTLVIEKWGDFFRDFRGDTIHPATMEILKELNLLDDFLNLPHDKAYQIEGKIGDKKVVIADFTYLKLTCPYVAFVPQWDFLNFLADKAKAFPSFKLMMETEAVDLIVEHDTVVGVVAQKHKGTNSSDKNIHIFADVVIAADGRHSQMREQSGLSLNVLSVPMDVLWFKLSRLESDEKNSIGRINLGQALITINRQTYWQCAYLIRKGEMKVVKEKGLDAFRASILELGPEFKDRVDEIQDWDQVKLLEVAVNRLEKWYRPGFLCIGDAAHAMSPIGGVGINLAIQDAVAAANQLIPAFLSNHVTEQDLAAIQKSRIFPTQLVQRIQVFLQNNVINNVLGNRRQFNVPFPIKLLNYFPILRFFPAYFIGVGFKREHVQSGKK